MVEQLTKALKLKTGVRKQPRDSLSTREGVAIPVWQAGATDPVAHMARFFDELPGRSRSLPGKHRNA